MLTIDEARRVLERYFAEHPPPIVGELHIDGWYEDDTDYAPVWGAREFLVDGHEEFARWDNLVIFIDKRTGAVRDDVTTLNLEKIREMTPVVAPE